MHTLTGATRTLVRGIFNETPSQNTSHRFCLFFTFSKISVVTASFKLHYGDMTDSSCLVKIISEVRPTEIYNLAAQSHVKVSQRLMIYCLSITLYIPVWDIGKLNKKEQIIIIITL